MKLLILGFLLYTGYRLIVPKSEASIDKTDNRQISDDEYTDYEEIE